MEAALCLVEVEKRFPGVEALKNVTFHVPAGEVRALVGENGAGKSTLIKIATGALRQEAGRVEICGHELAKASPTQAARLGLAVIHQERQIAPDLSVTENVLLGRLPARMPGVVAWTRAHRWATELIERVGLRVDPRCRAGELSVAEQQLIEIARALATEARVFIMDEPTASLGDEEVRRLFALVRWLKTEGKTVVFISHHLDEVFQVADSITVMRDGSIVLTDTTTGMTKDRLIELMFGESVSANSLTSARPHATTGPAVLEARDVRIGGTLDGVTLTAHAKELLCISGGIGSGRREFLRALGGARAIDGGEIRIGSHTGRLGSPYQALRSGIGFIPEDRKVEGIFPDLDVIENIGIPARILQASPFLDRRGQLQRAKELTMSLGVRAARLRMPARQLSGGNQQKLLLARLLAVNCQVLVLDEPTAGVDVSTKLEIYRLLRELVSSGLAVVIGSSDFAEIELLADRVVVLKRGQLVGELMRGEISERSLLGIERQVA